MHLGQRYSDNCITYYSEFVSFHVFGTISMCYKTVILKLGYATFA